MSPSEAAAAYMELNDFASALNCKGIYTDEIILGWIKDTYLVAHRQAMSSPEVLALVEALNGCGDNSCRIKRPAGMATNGGCRCRDRAAEVLSRFAKQPGTLIEKSAYLEVVKERNTAQHDFDVANERIRHLGHDITKLREQVVRLESHAKDHADDWKRIQDAERKCERLEAELTKAKNYDLTAAVMAKDIEKIAMLEGELAEAKTNVKTINDVCNENFLKLQTENARLLERYKHIEISNKEMTKNDHVTFGKLLTENAEAKESSLSIIKKLRAELDSKANENAELLEEIGRDTTKIGDLLHKVKMLDNKVANLDGDLEQSEYSLTAARAEVERYKSDWLYERDKRLRYGVALEWIAGKTDKPYCTYYERILPDGTEVPTYFDIAEKALKEST